MQSTNFIFAHTLLINTVPLTLHLGCFIAIRMVKEDFAFFSSFCVAVIVSPKKINLGLHAHCRGIAALHLVFVFG